MDSGKLADEDLRDLDRLIHLVAGLAAELRGGVAPTVKPDTALERELGFDSLTRVEPLVRIEREFGVRLGDRGECLFIIGVPEASGSRRSAARPRLGPPPRRHGPCRGR